MISLDLAQKFSFKWSAYFRKNNRMTEHARREINNIDGYLV